MSRAIAAARPSIKSAVAAGRQPTPQSTKQTVPMADCRSASIKALPRRRPAAIIPPLRRLVSPRLTRRSHPDCRAIDRVDRLDQFAQTQRYTPLSQGPDLILESVHRLLCGNGIEILP